MKNYASALALTAATLSAATMLSCTADTPASAQPTAAAPTGSAAVVRAAALTSVKVMPVGDSITYGIGDGGPSGQEDGYRCALKNRLAAAGQPIDYVGGVSNGPCANGDNQHEGHSGWIIDQIRDNIGYGIHAQHPQVILLMIGTNDVYRQVDLPNINSRYAALLAAIRDADPSVKVIASTIPQMNVTDTTRVNAWNKFRDDLPGIVQAAGYDVAYNDAIPYRLLPDGLHPQRCVYDGQMANDWAVAWYQAFPGPDGRAWAPGALPEVCPATR